MDITLTYADLAATVKRSLSIIGKRSIDDKGNLLFRDITLGSRETAIIYDFFTTAVTTLCSELNKFVTAEVHNITGYSSTFYTDFWTNQDAATFASQIRTNGQYLYRYDTNTLYVSALSYPFSTVSAETGTLFVYEDTFYLWENGAMTAQDEEELTEEQKEGAVRLSFFGTDPLSAVAEGTDVYLYYEGNIYRSALQKSFSQAEMPNDALIVDPQGRAYRREGNILINIPETATEQTVTFTLQVPENWNEGLQTSLGSVLRDYCVSYALYSWFTITAPRIAEKYLGDMQRSVAALIRLVYNKKAPEEPLDEHDTAVSPLSITTTVTG